jgi:endonuclease YncB( thermonuclease family)
VADGPRHGALDGAIEPALAVLGALACVLALMLLASPSARTAVSSVLAAAGGGPAGAERARVERAVDGDTLELSDGRLVRLLGIDAPESVNPAMAHPQPFGPEAGERLAALVGGRVVALEPGAEDRDHYGRLLRHVWLGRSLVAERLLVEGLGRVYLVGPSDRHAGRLRAAETAARRQGRGLWGLPRPTPLPIFGTPAP